MESSLALNVNIRLKWKSMEVANTLAYYNTVTITAVKSFIGQAPECFESSNLQKSYNNFTNEKFCEYDHGPVLLKILQP